MSNLTLSVPTISCGHCKASIEGAVSQVTGVESVIVNIEPKTVDLAFDGSEQTLDAIVAAIEEQGYDVAGR